MPETDTIPVSASVASTGPGIRYIGDYAYAYSGLIETDNTISNLLDFTTGAGIIQGRVQFNIDETGAGEAFEHQVLFNELVVTGLYLPWGNRYNRPNLIYLFI